MDWETQKCKQYAYDQAIDEVFKHKSLDTMIRFLFQGILVLLTFAVGHHRGHFHFYHTLCKGSCGRAHLLWSFRKEAIWTQPFPLGRDPRGMEVGSCHLLLSLLNVILVLAEQCRGRTVFFVPLDNLFQCGGWGLLF